MRNALFSVGLIGAGWLGGICWAGEPGSATQPSGPIETVPQFNTNVDALAKTIGDLPPDQAAKQWLQLVDIQLAVYEKTLTSEQFRSHQQAEFKSVLRALPAPTQWAALRTAIDQRVAAAPNNQHAVVLSLLIDALQGDSAAATKALEQFRKLGTDADRTWQNSQLDEIAKKLAISGAKPEIAAEAFEKEIAEPSPDGGYIPETEIPDLVTLIGTEKATPLLQKALMTRRHFSLGVGDETALLARKLALASAAQLPTVQWGLCDDANAVELYEAMVTRAQILHHPQATNFVQHFLHGAQSAEPDDSNSYERRRATEYYLLGLILKGRTDDAYKVAKEHKSEDGAINLDIAAIERAGFGKQVYALLTRIAKDDPATPYWDTLIEVASKIGRSQEVLDLVQAAYARTDLTPQQRDVVVGRLSTALLAADHVDEGVARLQDTLKENDPANVFNPAVRLATIGRIVSRPEWVKQGLDLAITSYSKISDTDPNIEVWSREMQHAGRQDELIKALGDHLAAQAAKAAKQVQRFHYSSFGEQTVPVEVASLYCKAGHAQEAIDWVDHYPNWKVADLAAIRIGSGGHGAPPPLAFWTAWALAKTGRTAEATPLLNEVLAHRGGLDPAYELLLQIDPDPIPKLDALFALDRFEERPLIWKAVLDRKAKKLDEAEALLRQAITIDPSDGEEGKGDRMRVYAVLAEVLEDKGDAKGATLFRNVVASIRDSEDADDAYNAGLLTRAVKMYTDALGKFADAYCIQARLAVQLTALGRMPEAEEHYRRAYELMPDSFGRVESHCFGCEGAFSGAAAQSVAERTFTSLLQKNPQKPQLHYLLGYLRTEENRYADAKREFAEAVRLDPDYLNAWIKLAECGSHVQLSPAEQDDAVLAQLRLDPLGRHSSVQNDDVHDLVRLYTAAATAVKLRKPPPEKLYPLAASAAELAKAKKDESEDFSDDDSPTYTAGGIVGSTERIRMIAELMNFIE